MGKRYWFEAIAPLNGNGVDRVPDVEFGKANAVPTEQVLLRYTSALSAKFQKYQSDRKKVIISENDGYIVAINANKIPHAFFGSFLPYHVQSFLPFGPPTIAINPFTQEKVDEYFQYRGEVKKKNNESIPTRAFLDPAYCGISAVIHSVFDIAGFTFGNATWGDNFDVLHNPLATNPLSLETLNWCKNRYLHDGKLETVEACPKLNDSPIANEGDWIKNCLKNPELLNDPEGWALREAYNVLDELHSELSGRAAGCQSKNTE